MAIIYIGLGFMLLVSGRPAYFVFTGVMSFLVGEYLANSLALAPASWNELIVPTIFAAIGVALAFAFKRWIAYIAGFIAGGFLVYYLPMVFGAQPAWATPVTFVIVGVVCILLMFFLFDIALVLLSSLLAATLILTGAPHFTAVEPAVMFIILAIFSLIVQYLLIEYIKPSPD